MKEPEKKAVERFRGLTPGRNEKFDTRGEAAIVALVCSPPPPGRTRWTVRLLAREAERQGIVASVGKETVRRLLESHELKPWREKMWCVPELTREYVERMADVLNLMERPANDREPVVALDERPVQLLATERMGRLVVHHTPKHGSWLNPAEIEVSLWSRECVGRDRIATLCELKYRTRLWNKAANRDRRKINWRFTRADARRVFRYRPGTTPGPKD